MYSEYIYMAIKEDLQTAQKEAMKSKNKELLTTIRGVLAAVQGKELEAQKDLTDEEIQQVIKTMVKQANDAKKDFVTAGRDDLIEQSDREIAALEAYLPAQLGDDELADVVKAAVADSGAQSKADMGKAMGAAVAAVAGRADGGRVKDIVMSLLS